MNALSLKMTLFPSSIHYLRTVDDSQRRSNVHRRQRSCVTMVNHVRIIGNECRSVLSHLLVDLYILS